MRPHRNTKSGDTPEKRRCPRRTLSRPEGGIDRPKDALVGLAISTRLGLYPNPTFERRPGDGHFTWSSGSGHTIPAMALP